MSFGCKGDVGANLNAPMDGWFQHLSAMEGSIGQIPLSDQLPKGVSDKNTGVSLSQTTLDFMRGRSMGDGLDHSENVAATCSHTIGRYRSIRLPAASSNRARLSHTSSTRSHAAC